jgi:type IV secretory pathway VirB2 component (pilin)
MTSPAAAAAEDRPRRRLYIQLWFWVVIAIAAGILFGLVAPDTAEQAKWLAEAFIQVIQAITGPVIFVTVVIGIASIGNLARAGGLAMRALAYFFGRGGRPGRLHHRQPAPELVHRAVRRERDPAHPRARHRHRGGDLVPRRPRARARRGGLRGARPDHLRRHPARHVGGADRRVRRHGLHGRGLRLRVARQPRRADADVLGDLRVLSCS